MVKTSAIVRKYDATALVSCSLRKEGAKKL